MPSSRTTRSLALTKSMLCVALASLIAMACVKQPKAALDGQRSRNAETPFIVNTIGDTLFTGIPITLEPVSQPRLSPPRSYPLKEPKRIENPNGVIKLGKGVQLNPKAWTDTSIIKHPSTIELTYEKEAVTMFRQQKVNPINHNSNDLYRIRRFGIEQGMFTDQGMLPTQDENGVIWFSTGSISSFDGTTVTEYALESENIFYPRGLIKDQDQRMWMNFDWYFFLSYFDGVNLYHTKLEGYKIVGTDHENNLLLHRDSSLFRIIDDEMHEIAKAFWINFGVSGCYLGPDNKVLISSFYGYWGEWRNDTLYSHNLGSNIGRINSITHSKDAQWFGCETGLYKLESDRLTRYGQSDGLAGSVVSELLTDNNHHLWVYYQEGVIDILTEFGVSHLSLEVASRPMGEELSAVRKMYLDQEGQIWIASESETFIVVDKSFLSPYILNPDTLEAYGDLAVGKNASIWVSSSSGIYNYDPSTNELYLYDDVHLLFPKLSEPLGITVDGESIWLSLPDYRAIARMTEDSLIIYGPNQGVTKIISDMEVDSTGILWLGSSTGLLSFDGEIFKDRLPGIAGAVNELSLDKSGDLILAHNNKMLFRHKESQWNIISENEGVAAMPWTVEEVDTDLVVSGTWTKGIQIFDQEKSFILDQSIGLRNNYINSISSDHYGTIWIRHNDGINSVSKQDIHNHLDNSESELIIDDITTKDGLKFSYFQNHMDDVLLEDKLWFSNAYALIELDLGKYTQSGKLGKLVLKDLLINEKRYS